MRGSRWIARLGHEAAALDEHVAGGEGARVEHQHGAAPEIPRTAGENRLRPEPDLTPAPGEAEHHAQQGEHCQPEAARGRG